LIEKSAGYLDLERLMIELLHLVEQVSRAQFWWDRRGIHRLTGLFSMIPQETHSQDYRRMDTLEFSKADFCILQTQLIDGR